MRRVLFVSSFSWPAGINIETHGDSAVLASHDHSSGMLGGYPVHRVKCSDWLPSVVLHSDRLLFGLGKD